MRVGRYVLGIVLAVAVGREDAFAQHMWQVGSKGAPEPQCAAPGEAPAPAHGWSARWHAFWSEVELHRRRVNVWPDPFVLPDRELVRTPFRMMADNGWRLQTTLSDHLFTEDTNELTYAGQLKLHWIVTQIPPHRRRIYVQEGHTREETGTRVASVYKHLADICPQGIPCPVYVTQIAPRGADGAYLNDLDKAYKAGLPAPRLSSGEESSGTESGDTTGITGSGT